MEKKNPSVLGFVSLGTSCVALVTSRPVHAGPADGESMSLEYFIAISLGYFLGETTFELGEGFWGRFSF